MIRSAEPNDIPHVWELIVELADFEKLRHAVTGDAEQLAAGLNKHYYCFVCEEAGEIVGYCLGFNTYSTFRTQPGLWLEDLYVTPALRGQGQGKAMLTFLVDWCRREGFGRLEWSVLDWNEGAIGFYEKMGAEVMPEWRICRVSF